MITIIEIIMLSSVFSGTPLAFQRRNLTGEANQPLGLDGRWFARYPEVVLPHRIRH